MSDDATTTEATTTEETAEEVERDEAREQLLASFTDALGDAIVGSHVVAGRDLWIRVTTDAWLAAADVARNRLGARYFGFLSMIDWAPSPFRRSMDAEVDNALAGEPQGGPATIDLSGIEQGYAGGETRFQAFARVASIGVPGEFWGVTLKADVPDEPFEIDSWTSIYAGADWHEREAWEMFGVSFRGHPGLRHIYLPSGFEGHPLRKDFPLVSRQVKPWPGIVDVEQFPDEGDGDSDGSGDAEGGDS